MKKMSNFDCSDFRKRNEHKKKKIEGNDIKNADLKNCGQNSSQLKR